MRITRCSQWCICASGVLAVSLLTTLTLGQPLCFAVSVVTGLALGFWTERLVLRR